MAARNIGSLTIDLILKTVGLTQGADKAQRELEKRAKEIEKTAKRVGAAVGTALVAGGALVANQLKNTINQMDELSKAAQRASLPTEEFSKLAYAGELADVSIQDLQASLGRLAKAQADAEKSTSTQGRIFDALGISTKNAEGNLRSTYEVFLDFADAFQEYQGSPEIVAAGLNIFGRSFQNLIPLLKDGSEGLKAAGIEAEQLGLVLSTEAGQQAEQFNDDLTRLKSSLTGLWREVAAQVLPQLVQLSGEFVQAAKEGDVMKKSADAIAESLRAVAQTASLFVNLLTKLGELRDMLVAIEQAGQRFSLGNLAGIGDQVRSVLPDWLYKPLGGSGSPGMPVSRAPGREMDPTLGAPLSPAEMAARNATLRGISGAFGDAAKKGGGGKSKEQQEAEQLQKSYESLMASMRERIALFNAEGEAAKVAYDLENGQLKMLDAAKKQELITEAQRYDALVKRREADEAAYELAKQETDRIKRGLDDGAQLVDDLEFELRLMKMTNVERATAIQLRGMESEAVKKYGDQVRELNRQIQEDMEKAAFFDGIRSEFSDFIMEVVDGTSSIKDAFKGMLDNINQMIAQKIADQWVEQLFGAMGSTDTGSSGGWMATLAGMFAGGRASGGWIGGGKLAEVNERGLEMATVNGRSYLLAGNSPVEITPNHKLPGGGMSQVNNFMVQGRIDRRTQDQIAQDVGRRASTATRRNG